MRPPRRERRTRRQQPLLEEQDPPNVESQRLVERNDRAVVRLHVQVDLRAALASQPPFDLFHQPPSQTSTACFRSHRQVVHPAAVPVEATEDRAHDSSVLHRHQEQVGVPMPSPLEPSERVGGTQVEAGRGPKPPDRRVVGRTVHPQEIGAGRTDPRDGRALQTRPARITLGRVSPAGARCGKPYLPVGVGFPSSHAALRCVR